MKTLIVYLTNGTEFALSLDDIIDNFPVSYYITNNKLDSLFELRGLIVIKSDSNTYYLPPQSILYLQQLS